MFAFACLLRGIRCTVQLLSESTAAHDRSQQADPRARHPALSGRGIHPRTRTVAADTDVVTQQVWWGLEADIGLSGARVTGTFRTRTPGVCVECRATHHAPQVCRVSDGSPRTTSEGAVRFYFDVESFQAVLRLPAQCRPSTVGLCVSVAPAPVSIPDLRVCAVVSARLCAGLNFTLSGRRAFGWRRPVFGPCARGLHVDCEPIPSGVDNGARYADLRYRRAGTVGRVGLGARRASPKVPCYHRGEVSPAHAGVRAQSGASSRQRQAGTSLL